MNRKTLWLAAVAASCAIALPQAASAGLAINAAGAADGFSLSLFTTMPQSGPYGAWGSAVLSNGNVVVNGYAGPGSGSFVNRVFTDVDGHAYTDALSTKAWNDFDYASALTRLGSTVYGTEHGSNTVRVVNLDGSQGAIISNVGRGGIDADAARNSLLAATDLGIVEIDLSNPDPATNFRYVGGCGGTCVDGVTVSTDGQTVYGEQGGHILGFNIATATQVYDSGFLGDPDGVGVIRGGALAGQLILNNNNGTVSLLNTLTNTVTTIAEGGSRGDFVGFDPTNGTVFLSQSDSLLRLSLSTGTIGGGGGGGAPEPATWVMAILGFGMAGGALRRRRGMASAAA